MKKQTKKVNLSRETLHALESGNLREALGGVYTHPPVCDNSNSPRGVIC
ncbi:MAG: hypothetical protein JOZ15_14170 [Acidobacteria bacterium]|nr:hypothetical protein [Acidobacteriota bacterium]